MGHYLLSGGGGLPEKAIFVLVGVPLQTMGKSVSSVVSGYPVSEEQVSLWCEDAVFHRYSSTVLL
jgi:hypothetical protein